MLPFPFQFGGLGMTLPQSAGDTDPYFSNVVALLHMDGTNGSTTFTDSAPSPKTFTASGNAQISTTQSKFGGAALALDGSGDYISTPAAADFAFGTGDFTIECFLRLNASPNGGAIIAEEFTGAGNAVMFTLAFCSGSIGTVGGDKLCFGNYDGSSWAGAVAPSALSLNTWYHIAAVRNGNVWTIYVDGTSVATNTFARTISQQNQIFIGRRWDTAGTASYLNAYIDEVRITKDVARYTANFTPPTAPFPNTDGGGGVITSSKWRIYINAVQSFRYVAFYNLEMRATIGGATQCVGGTATASSESAAPYVAANAFDGNDGTSWTCAFLDPPHWIQYEFTSPVSVAEILIRSGWGDSPASWKLQYWDGSAWVDKFTKTDDSWPDGYVNHTYAV